MAQILLKFNSVTFKSVINYLQIIKNRETTHHHKIKARREKEGQS
jgi:hypothetical protein